ncbi:MAG TPA: ELM1/GtrOC1 family putative glycosyltransferase, partial [Xanthomonadales bacterium]|nr:ELM1/GtrOC1 family putative glycosyltransferase [Xanthomonadales bacterium]
RIDARHVHALVRWLRETHAADGGGFLVTTSRRTDDAALAALRRGFADLPARLWSSDRDGPNPYLAFLAHAQRIVVTPDSVNLASEACATGKPVYVHALDPVRGKLARFHHELFERGHARPLAAFDPAWQAVALRETQGVADEVWRRIRRIPSPADAGVSRE